MYEVYIVTCGGHKDMVEPEKANGDRFFIIKEDAEKYLSENIIPESRKHYRVQTVIMYSEDDHKESGDNINKIQNEQDKIISTLEMLCSLMEENYIGSSLTYAKIGHTLVGKGNFSEFYKKYLEFKTKDNWMRIGYTRISKRHFYGGGGFANPRYFRRMRSGSWQYYYQY